VLNNKLPEIININFRKQHKLPLQSWALAKVICGSGRSLFFASWIYHRNTLLQVSAV